MKNHLNLLTSEDLLHKPWEKCRSSNTTNAREIMFTFTLIPHMVIGINRCNLTHERMTQRRTVWAFKTNTEPHKVLTHRGALMLNSVWGKKRHFVSHSMFVEEMLGQEDNTLSNTLILWLWRREDWWINGSSPAVKSLRWHRTCGTVQYRPKMFHHETFLDMKYVY